MTGDIDPAIVGHMAIFLVLPKTAEAQEAIAPRIAEQFPRDSLALASGDWLLSASATSKEISESLGITGPGARGPSAIVFSIAGYYGRAPNEVWEWMKEKMEGGAGV